MSMNTEQTAVFTIIRRDILIGFRHMAELVHPVLFFLIIVSMFPLALGPEPEELSRIAPAVIWIAAILTSSLSLETVFRSDYEDGSLEQILLSPCSTTLLISAKIFAHWILSGAPLLIFCSRIRAFFIFVS